MVDTAQLAGAAETDPNAQLANAADAFKAFVSGEPVVQPRDPETGKFTSAEVETEDNAEPEAEAPAEAEGEANEDETEAVEEETQPPPTSWPADKAELWETLPAETKAYLAERDAEQTRAVQTKFQESANARKAADAEREQAQTTRKQLADTLDVLLSAVIPAKPDPRAFGAGTGQYNREAYDLAITEWEEQATAFHTLKAQREAIADEEAKEAEAAFTQWKEAVEAEFAPKLLNDIPELTDPSKAGPLIGDMIGYAIANGLPEELFAEDRQAEITSPQLHLLWKAMQYDKLRVNPPQPKPKAAGPAVKPGVSSPRSAQAAAQRAKISDRLAREGSVEAGAAMWKSILKG